MNHKVLALITLFLLSLSLTVYSSPDDTMPAYYGDVKTLFDGRCVVCHGCYDAPCQLKLSSPEGIQRGANKKKIYNGTRLFADDPTRLFVDAHGVDAWRDKRFFSVVEAGESGKGLEKSLLYQMLSLKERKPISVASLHNQLLPDDTFDLRLNRKDQCPKPDEFQSYANDHALWGMPYGLPGLNAKEQLLVKDWLRHDMPMGKAPVLSEEYSARIAKWETFLNQGGNRSRLVARYIYEHLFLADIFFDDVEVGRYFKLVRSITPPGVPIKIIATRRPYEDPTLDPNIKEAVPRVYYRLQVIHDTVVAKNHIPYGLNDKRLARFKALFFEPNYEVTSLPGYAIELASNPFAVFKQLPVESRYQFMLDQAEFTIQGFMKGTVCRGQVALNVINDHFWVVFADPQHPASIMLNNSLPSEVDLLDLPAEQTSNAGILEYWTEYSKNQARYLKHKSKLLNDVFIDHKPSLDWVWQGEGTNKNAALTVFRHFDSASVVKGFVGPEPKTVWFIDYPIFERIHYLLVAGFDVYGNAGHQLATRLYMDFLRMESEFNFLTLLPKKARPNLKDYWYRDAERSIKNYVYGTHAYLNVESNIVTSSDGVDAKNALSQQLKQYLAPVLSDAYQLRQQENVSHKQLALLMLMAKGKVANLLPEMGLLMVTENQQIDQVYTLVRNSAHAKVTSLFTEALNRLPEEDSVSVMPGIVGAYPDALWRVEKSDLAGFVKTVIGLNNEADYSAFMQQFGIRRTHADFWQYSDELHHYYQQHFPIEYGVLDYNRLENR